MPVRKKGRGDAEPSSLNLDTTAGSRATLPSPSSARDTYSTALSNPLHFLGRTYTHIHPRLSPITAPKKKKTHASPRPLLTDNQPPSQGNPAPLSLPFLSSSTPSTISTPSTPSNPLLQPPPPSPPPSPPRRPRPKPPLLKPHPAITAPIRHHEGLSWTGDVPRRGKYLLHRALR